MLNQNYIIIKTINLFNTLYRVVIHFMKVHSMISKFIAEKLDQLKIIQDLKEN